MKKIGFAKALTLASSLSLLLVFKCGAIIAYNNPTTLTGNQTSGPYDLGMVFQVNSTIEVTALGAFDSGLNGFVGTPTTVAIYSVNSSWMTGTTGGNGTRMGEVTFNAAAGSYTYSGSTALQNTTPFDLTAGTYMIVANNYGAGTGANSGYNSKVDVSSTPPTYGAGTSPYLTFGTGGFRHGTGTLGDPLPSGTWTFVNGPGSPNYAAGDFVFTPVPEAASFAVAGVAMLGLVYSGRFWISRRRQMTVA